MSDYNQWQLTVADQKYRLEYNQGKMTAYRHGERWQNLTGNNLVYALASELIEARADLVTQKENHERQLADLQKEVTRLKDMPLAVLAAADDEQLESVVSEAIGEALGEAYDCTRVWQAWGVGTMSEEDFVMIKNDLTRLTELSNAALSAIRRYLKEPKSC